MKNWHKWFLLLLWVAFTCMYCKLQTFSFDCSNGYWSDWQCITNDWIWSFSLKKQCIVIDDWREDNIWLSKAHLDILDIDNQIQQAETLLRDLQSRKDTILSNIANMPKVAYKNTICKNIEIPTYQSIPRYIIEVWANIDNDN